MKTKKRRPRGGAIAQYLKNRGLRVDVNDVYLTCAGYRIRVTRGNVLPKHERLPSFLDSVGEGSPLAGAVVRVIDPDPGRALLIMRLEDGLRALLALDELEVKR